MMEFISIDMAGCDENSTNLNVLPNRLVKDQAVERGGTIRLRDLNTKSHRPASQGISESVAYFKKKEKTTRRIVQLQDESQDLGDLGEIRSKYIPDSPSLWRTLNHHDEVIAHSPLNKLLSIENGPVLELTPISNVYESDFDCQPFYHVYDYENRLEADDYESILHQMVEDDLKNERPVFDRELEYQELKKIVGTTDYILYYFFGIDRLQFFQLKQERDKFQTYTYESYTRPLNYSTPAEDEENGDGHYDSMSEDRESDQFLWETSSIMSLDKCV
ncbi:BN860_05116g1_1 [Zygosaccharomyces bailii CLIB 213]|uniref:BN860_05116g1_1 n=1 Tax=Zygosaccharomyces bailii (strain CLIB 213 / ATCC 58445 / CBS 680 / BCRC 21525 / NBRC 1098 / NCYC 1416 / NRRL Y-2227) TaxID=1333698 RepID=A0A8J2T253_ZYGB2|nr:BN860_05116g1_1 [Zygosaccharomyces bailii CLIB 213]